MLQYPRYGTFKVPNYVSTWVTFVDGKIVASYKSKPSVEEIKRTKTELSDDEVKRFISCFTTASVKDWVRHDYAMMGATEVIREYPENMKQEHGYIRQHLILRDGELLLHKWVGPAQILANGKEEYFNFDKIIKRYEPDTNTLTQWCWDSDTKYRLFINGEFKGLFDSNAEFDDEPLEITTPPQKAESDGIGLWAVLAITAGAAYLSSKKTKKKLKKQEQTVDQLFEQLA